MSSQGGRGRGWAWCRARKLNGDACGHKVGASGFRCGSHQPRWCEKCGLAHQPPTGKKCKRDANKKEGA